MKEHYLCISVSIYVMLIFLVYLLHIHTHTSTTILPHRPSVISLPGFLGSLPFHLETGYIGIDESGDVQLFYYFVKSESSPQHDPLLLWTSGGPGASVISGFAYEIGPLRFQDPVYNGTFPTLVLNPNSWTKVANIIFLDSPVGTGFSYSKSAEDLAVSDTKASRHAYQFLRKWLQDRPEFLSNPVYIGGDSYAGKITPILVQTILDANEAGNKPFIDIKGYVIGNPYTNSSWDNRQVPYAHRMGLISDEIYESIKRNCGGEYIKRNVNPNNTQCLKDLDEYSECVDGINEEHISKPQCPYAPEPKEVSKNRTFQVEISGPISLPMPKGRNRYQNGGCKNYDYLIAYHWANDIKVRKALHIREGSVPTFHMYKKPDYKFDITTSYQYHVNLSTQGYRSLVYSGDHDMQVPFLGTQAWIQSLNYSIVDDWRPWFVDSQVGGYTRTFANKMTFATVKAGSHVAAQDRPRECYVMFKRWISNEPL